MTTIECPRCGLDFESRATTATRCPICRAVVHVSRRTRSTGRSASRAPSRVERAYDDSDPGEGGGAVVIAALVALAGWLLWQWRRSRQSRPDGGDHPMEPAAGPYTFAAPASTSGPVGPGVGRAPFAATGEPGATRAHTEPSEDKPGQLE